MKNNFFIYFRPNILVSLIAIFGIVLYMAKSHLQLSFAISGSISMALIIISNYLWNVKPFKWLFWIEDFSGRYEGILKYSYVDENGIHQSGERKHIKRITQKGNLISIASFTLKEDGTKSSPSYSKGLFVEQTEDGQHYRIIYQYLNEGNQQHDFHPHFGTDVLKFIKDGNKKILSGQYYTNRIPQTRGEYIDLKWVSNNQKDDF